MRLTQSILSLVFVALAPSASFAQAYASGAQPASATQSPRYEYFRKILAKGARADIRELLQFWSPDKHRAIVPSEALLQCQAAPWGPLRVNSAGDIASNCKPDVLYSWGSLEKLQSVVNTLRDGARWSGNPNPGGHSGIYATLSPAATFNYGSVPIRIKLKNGTGFYSLDNDKPAPNKVMYSGLRMNDFLIEDSRVIGSWSFGTADHYDELVEDILRISQNSDGQGYALRPPVGNGLDRLFSVMVPERGRADEANLKKVLLQMLNWVVNDQGRIVYQNGSNTNSVVHFQKRY